VLRLASRMLGMVITRILSLLSAICPKVSLFSLVVLRFASSNPRVMILRVLALMPGICSKVFLFFISSFKVCFLKSTNGDTLGLGPILCYSTERFAVFASSFKVSF